MNLVLVVLWSLAMPYSTFRPMTSCLSTIWVCVIIVCKMLYQLSVVNPIEYSSNCTRVGQTHTHTGDAVIDVHLYTEPTPTRHMCFQRAWLVQIAPLSSLQPLTNETNLSPAEVLNSALYKEPVDPAKWFGIRKDATVLGYSKVGESRDHPSIHFTTMLP